MALYDPIVSTIHEYIGGGSKLIRAQIARYLQAFLRLGRGEKGIILVPF